jgi:hypothetical protein
MQVTQVLAQCLALYLPQAVVVVVVLVVRLLLEVLEAVVEAVNLKFLLLKAQWVRAIQVHQANQVPLLMWAVAVAVQVQLELHFLEQPLL